MVLQLPHSLDCLVCGRQNPHGLHLDLFVDPDRSIVTAEFIPADHHAGFDKVVHGGLLATVLDEAMTWAATWAGKRFCFCAELTTRFRNPVRPGGRCRIEAAIAFSRPKLVETSAKLLNPAGVLTATALGRYLPMSVDDHRRFIATMVQSPATAQALVRLS